MARTKEIEIRNTDNQVIATRTAKNAREVVQRLIDEGVSLAGADLKGLNLKKVDFREADITKANFTNTILTNAKFTGTDASGTKFSNTAIKKYPVIKKARNIHKAVFVDKTGFQLTNIFKSSVTIRDMLDNEITTISPCFSDKDAVEQACLEETSLSKANLTKMNLNGAVLKNQKFSKTAFNGALLKGANLAKTTQELTSFESADLTNADFTKSNFIEVKLKGAKLKGADFSGVSFYKTNLKKVNVEGATFSQSALDELNFDAALNKTKAIFIDDLGSQIATPFNNNSQFKKKPASNKIGRKAKKKLAKLNR